jgi:hypothetical protein
MYPRIGQFDGVSGPDGEGSVVNTSTASTAPVASTSPVTAATNSEYRGNAGGSAAATPKVAKPINKSNWDRNVKVSQSTVDSLKKGGIKQAAAMSKMNAGAAQGGLASEYQEATKRVYPTAYTSKTQASNSAASGRSNSPYGFGGVGAPKKRGVGGGGKVASSS